MFRVLSRYKSPRTFTKISDNLVQMIGEEVIYFESSGCYHNPLSIDPDGGPYLAVGQPIEFKPEKFEIQSFNRVELDQKTQLLTVLMNVKKIE